MVSILMLTYNAPQFVKHSIITLKNNTQGVPYELIVLDNNSNQKTRKLLLALQKSGYIDKLVFEKKNTFFAKGNNTASLLCSPESQYILLLNSDVEIRDANWLKNLLLRHERGVISYGVCEGEPCTRADGYCFLIDKDLYLRYRLDEKFEWWWSITKLQAQLLQDSFKVKAVKKHDSQMFHFGGMSGTAWKNSKGMEIEGQEIKIWFAEHSIEIIDEIDSEFTTNKNSHFSNVVCQRKKRKEFFRKFVSLIKRMLPG